MFNFLEFLVSLFKKPKKGRGTGWIPDIKDYRDIPLSAISKKEVSTPENYSIPYKLTMKDQGSNSQCVAYVCSTIKEYLERKEGHYIKFDPDWIYKRCKEIDNYNGPGTYFKIGLKTLLDKGAMPN